MIGLEASDAPRISAKTGENVEEVLEQIVHRLPAPTGDPEAPLQALIFDSIYDSYKGVIVFFRIREGSIRPGDAIKMMATGATADVVEVGYFGAGQFIPCDGLSAGMVGYLTASIKNVKDTRWATPLPIKRIPAPSRCRDIRRSIPWCTAACTRRTGQSTRICGTRWRSCS